MLYDVDCKLINNKYGTSEMESHDIVHRGSHGSYWMLFMDVEREFGNMSFKSVS